MVSQDPRRDHAIRLALLSAFLVVVYFGVLDPSGLLGNARWHAQDQLLQLRHRWQRPPAAARDLVLAKIDDISLRTLQQQWPWNRGLFAQLLERIGQERPRAIALDFTFVGSSTAEADEALASAIHRYAPVFLAAYIDPSGQYVMSEPRFAEAGGLSGLINKPRDKDLVVRRLWPAIQLPGRPGDMEYAVEVKIAAQALGADLQQVTMTPRQLRFATTAGAPLRRLPLDGPTLLINPLVTTQDLPAYSCAEILAGKVSPGAFAGKIVLVGTTSEITHDIYGTPLGLMPGVALSANALLTILTERALHPLPVWLVGLVCFGVAYGAGLAAFSLPAFLSALATLGLAGAAVALSFWATWLDAPTDWFSPTLVSGLAWLGGAFYRYLVLVLANATMRQQAMTDVSSGALTARQGRRRVKLAYDEARAARHPASLLFIEPLQAETTTDEPATLRALAEHLQTLAPPGSSVARTGLERFCVVLPRTGTTQALRWAQQALTAHTGHPLVIGLSDTTFPEMRSSKDWVACAEAALHRARHAIPPMASFDPATDRVVLGTPEEAAPPPTTDHVTELMADLEERNQELEQALTGLREAHHEMHEAFIMTAKVLVRALETKDPYTAGHSERVSNYAARLAERLHVPPREVEEIREAGLLHDIGKIGLPEGVLHKVGALTDEERNAIRLHHAEGSRILEPLKHFKQIIPLVYYHHERYDGKGFPHGLAGDLIPIGAQIIAVVDSFDAMTTNRGYNVLKTPEEGIVELRRCAGTQFNPAYVEAFAQLIQNEGTAIGSHAP